MTHKWAAYLAIGWPPCRVAASLARSGNRILVTFNVADFPRIARQWAEERRTHYGCAIVIGIDHSEFGTIIRVLERTLAGRPDPAQWSDYTCVAARAD
jgi:hypothetical protein